VSAGSRDFAKGIVVTLVVTGVGSIFGGWVLGVICFFVAGGLSLVLWTPFGRWLGYHDGGAKEVPEAPDPCRELLILLRGHANQLAWSLEHFWNWWDAVHDPDFKGKLPDGYGPTTHADAMETLLFMFGQFFSTAWTYQSFCLQHPDRAAVKALVDEVYWALGKAGDPQDLTDARIGSDQLHLIGERSTREWGTVNGRSVPRSDFKTKLEYHAAAFEPLKEVLYAADRGTSARRRLDEAADAARAVEQWLTDNGYGP
jgi:hypothetical protein